MEARDVSFIRGRQRCKDGQGVQREPEHPWGIIIIGERHGRQGWSHHQRTTQGQLIFHFGGGPEGFDEGETAITEPLEARHRLSTQEYAVCAL